MNVVWLSEIALEAFGCFLFSRRKLGSLAVWLWFRTVADLARLVIQQLGFPRTDIWAEYGIRHAQYAVLAIACVACVAGILREHRKAVRFHQWAMGAVALIGVILLHVKWPPSADKVLLFEAGAECFLAGFIVLALAQAGKAPQPWGVIAGALLLLTVSDAIVTMLARQDWAWASWYPLGAIPALALLCWAGWKDWRLEEFRRALPTKVESLWPEAGEYWERKLRIQ